MKPVRKSKDFSIESILSDTFIFLQNDQRETKFDADICNYNYEEIQIHQNPNIFDINLKLNVETDLITCTKSNSQCILKKPELSSIKDCKILEGKEECLTSKLRKNDKFSEKECCDVNLKRHSDFDTKEGCEIRLKKYSEEMDRSSKQFNNNEIKQLEKNEIGTFSDCHIKESNENWDNKASKSYDKNLEQMKNKEFDEDKTDNLEVTKKLEWLQFTRYRPPKIPRKSRLSKNKRKPSLHPRIPFSTFQVDFLEQKFRNSAYLSRNDVLNISVALQLPPSRVKIWFQNRRARERRTHCTEL